MSHRKRVRAYWNRIARERRAAELLASLNAFFKRAYAERNLLPSADKLKVVER
jgi:hypothetical protein